MNTTQDIQDMTDEQWATIEKQSGDNLDNARKALRKNNTPETQEKFEEARAAWHKISRDLNHARIARHNPAPYSIAVC